MNRAIARWAGLAAILLIAACGFQLRTWDLGDALQAVHIDADGSVDLDRPLAQAIRSAKVRIAAAGADADVTVRLSDQQRERRNVAVTAGRAAEYEMSLAVRFAVVTGAGDVLAETDLTASRVARLDRNNIVGSSEEQALLAERCVRISSTGWSGS